ncbi:MAG: hypothetical protein M8357_01890 [Desulfobulbaceae bacterium]|nr:hypothetical protein [Desulfobulbaceae bacterium]
MKYQIKKEDNLPYYLVQLSGPLCLDQLEKCYVEIINHPQWKPDTDILWDAQQCIFDHLDSEDLNSIGTMTLKYKEKRGRGKAAWVVAREIDFGVSRMFDILSEGKVAFHFRVFKNMQNARQFFSQGDD